MTGSKISASHSRQLFVENKDMHAIIQLTAQHGCDWANPSPKLPYLYPAGDRVSALQRFGVTIKGEATRTGIVVDADADAAGVWAAISNHLRAVNVHAPASLPAEGWVGGNAQQRFGAWIMPNNQAPGNLEDFLARLVPAGDACWPHAQTSTDQAAQLGAPFAAVDRGKAAIHTWLAWREEPGLPFGTAMKARYFAHDTPEALAFVSWFRRLFLED